MPATRLARALTLGLLAVALAAPAAQAATTVEHERAAGINLDVLAFGVTAACGFPVELHSVGKEVITSHYKDGVLVSESRHLVYDGYLLNPANGQTVSSKVAGTDRTIYLADGSLVATSTGTTHRNVPGAGLVSGFIGRDYVVLAPTGDLDEDGFPIYDEVDGSSHGQFLGNDGMCGILS